MVSRVRGQNAEHHALAYLRAQGLRWVASNYQARCGEIDLIMREDETLVFVEVRQRSSARFGGAGASITWSKQQKIIKTALCYMQHMRIQPTVMARFDVVTFDGIPPTINWIKHAFACG
jgi:putative endonuclease